MILLDNALDQKCGCGKDGRYLNIKTGLMSCNKRGRCMSYEELLLNVRGKDEKIRNLEFKLKEIRKSFSVVKALFAE